jgi:hypothetical protein
MAHNNKTGFYILDGKPAKPIAFVSFPETPAPFSENSVQSVINAVCLNSAKQCVENGGKISVHVDDLGRGIAKKLIKSNGTYL